MKNIPETVYVAIVNDQFGDPNVFGPFKEQSDAIHFCQTSDWGQSYTKDETGQVPFSVEPLLSVKDSVAIHG